MLIKIAAVAALLVTCLPLTAAPQVTHVTQDDGGDLNPQPLPPIAEEG